MNTFTILNYNKMNILLFNHSWENVFTDQESGIAYYEWAVGSHPGHADVMPFNREDSESGVNDPSQPLNLHEGHSYFISIKVSIYCMQHLNDSDIMSDFLLKKVIHIHLP